MKWMNIILEEPNIQKFLVKEKGFHWNHADSRGFDVYVSSKKEVSIAVKVPSDPVLPIEVHVGGQSIGSFSRETFIRSYSRILGE